MAINEQQLDWNALKSFIVAAREGSFSKAAQCLGVTQPTLSRQVYQLEQMLNITLFERFSTGLSLTESGAHLLKHAIAMEQGAQQVSLAIAGFNASLEGEVSVSVSEIDALFRMPEIIRFIRQQAPNIRLTVQVDNQVSDIKRREADIALRSFQPNEPDLIAKKLIDEPIWFYGTQEWASRYQHAKSPAEVRDVEIIGFEREGELIRRLAPLGWQLSEQNFPIVTPFQGLQWELVKAGQGVGFFPQAIGDKETSLRRVFEHFGAPITVPLWLVSHRELRTNHCIKKVFDLMVERLCNPTCEPISNQGG